MRWMSKIGQNVFDSAKDHSRSCYDSNRDAIQDRKDNFVEKRGHKRNINKISIGLVHDQNPVRGVFEMRLWLSVKRSE